MTNINRTETRIQEQREERKGWNIVGEKGTQNEKEKERDIEKGDINRAKARGKEGRKEERGETQVGEKGNVNAGNSKQVTVAGRDTWSPTQGHGAGCVSEGAARQARQVRRGR